VLQTQRSGGLNFWVFAPERTGCTDSEFRLANTIVRREGSVSAALKRVRAELQGAASPEQKALLRQLERRINATFAGDSPGAGGK
jgi:hypothetical protein